MNDARSDLTNPSRRLPDLELPSLGHRGSVKVRSGGRTSPVVALLHGAECEHCTAYLHELAERHGDIAAADGRLIAVLSTSADGADGSDPDVTGSTNDEGASHPSGSKSADDARTSMPDVPFPVLLDRDLRLASALDVQPPAIVTADQWGGIHSIESAGEAHDFPGVQDLLASLNYLSVQCPECEGEAL